MTSKLFLPTLETATPSANNPTFFKRTRLLDFSASVKHAESSTSTPIILIFFLFCLTQADIPARRPPPPTGINKAS